MHTADRPLLTSNIEWKAPHSDMSKLEQIELLEAIAAEIGCTTDPDLRADSGSVVYVGFVGAHRKVWAFFSDDHLGIMWNLFPDATQSTDWCYFDLKDPKSLDRIEKVMAQTRSGERYSERGIL
jgi:hypothetical protein